MIKLCRVIVADYVEHRGAPQHDAIAVHMSTVKDINVINTHYLDVLRIRTTRSVQEELGRITADECSFSFFLSTTHIFRGVQPEGERDSLMGLGFVHNVCIVNRPLGGTL